MKIEIGFPPMYREIAARFTLSDRTIFCWDETIFNPSGMKLPKDLIAHEEVHMVQQNRMPATWWRRYLDDSEFRLAQEAEAYGRQYEYVCSENPNRNYQFQVLQALAMHLAGPMYGRMVTIEAAMGLIREAVGKGATVLVP